jgi:hypothetical protein
MATIAATALRSDGATMPENIAKSNTIVVSLQHQEKRILGAYELGAVSGETGLSW